MVVPEISEKEQQGIFLFKNGNCLFYYDRVIDLRLLPLCAPTHKTTRVCLYINNTRQV